MFFAIRPEPELRERLFALGDDRLRAGGRRVVAENLHLTLVFLGSLDAALRQCLEQGADAFQSGRLLWMDDVESGAQALLRKAGIPATPTVVKMLEKYLEGLVFTDNYEHYLLWSWMRGAWKDEAARNSVIEAYRIVRWVIEGLGLGVQFPKLADIVN